ncbi:MAG TPA: C13 family peptidase [Burkholderiales bacterium]|nr:C13 family peptidase [Burkholderiales bacterium]
MLSSLRTALPAFLLWLAATACAAATPDAITPDGGRYYGPLVDGKLHGRGRIEWANGAVYEGELANGLASGKGRMRTANGGVYEGEFRDGMMSGRGRFEEPDRQVYEGGFKLDYYWGKGEQRHRDGRFYRGEFVRGEFDGKGRFEYPNGDFYEGDFTRGEFTGTGRYGRNDGTHYEGEFLDWQFHGRGKFTDASGEVYEGDFSKGKFTGTGRHARKDGSRYEGEFRDWRFEGRGRFTDRGGDVWEGSFVDGRLEGPGRASGRRGTYEGEFKDWRFHGKGRLKLANGDFYEGGFEQGVYEGEGILTYAKAKPDGRKVDSGVWHYGVLPRDAEHKQARDNVEVALYGQKELLDKALASLKPREPGRINLYLLAVAGDGSQEVFRREVEFVQGEFASRFGTSGRTVALVNSRSTVATAPMATVTSIRQALKAIAARMDREQDILFLFLTSHGSAEHELSLTQNGMDLADLPAKELGAMLKESGIRWKVVVVSACYSGGFIDPLQDEKSLIITAARRDRRSFGCADENDFTYFGRAFFKESLPKSRSFSEAFRRAETLVRDWERRDSGEAAPAGSRDAKMVEENQSYPQISNAAAIDAQLKRWWAQSPR